MYKINENYPLSDFSHNLEIRGKEVMVYPENKLTPISVTSDFGDCQVITSDIYDLFNQTRIQNLGIDVVRDFIARNYPVNSSISDAISKMSDDELMNSIKPRNIQSYSELMAWSKYLNTQIENGLKSVELDHPTDLEQPDVSEQPKTE